MRWMVVLGSMWFAVFGAIVAPAAEVTARYTYPSSVTPELTHLKAELNYDSRRTGAPIAVVMHGFSGSDGHFHRYRPHAQRLRDRGFFVLTVAMRGRDGSDGVRDSGGVEIHDIYDAVEAVVADGRFARLVDGTTVYITGYSGGGGNVMSALTKFPDYFRAGAAFFGMSDYGYDPACAWWHHGSAASHRAILARDVGNPETGGPAVRDRYMARASNLASRNNPYTEIHLFVNHDETTCPPVHSTSYRDLAVAGSCSIRTLKPELQQQAPCGTTAPAGRFGNIRVHLGRPGRYHDFNGDGADQPEEHQYWPHHAPTADEQAAAERWFLDRLLAGEIARPELNDAGSLFVAGYVKTRKFGLWLGDGRNAAAELDYALSDAHMQFAMQLLTSDRQATGALRVDTSRMGGRPIDVLRNGKRVDSFRGGGWYAYPGLSHGDVLRLQAAPAGDE